MTRAQAGDEAAFDRLASLIGSRLYAVAYRILREAELAEDAAQQALLAIWRDLPTLRDPDRLLPWCYRVVAHACAEELRRRRRWDVALRAITVGGEPQGDPYARIAERDAIERAFRRLSVEHRAVVVFYHYLDLPLPDVADALGIPAGTARSRLHYAHRALRAALDADDRAVPEAAR